MKRIYYYSNILYSFFVNNVYKEIVKVRAYTMYASQKKYIVQEGNWSSSDDSNTKSRETSIQTRDGGPQRDQEISEGMGSHDPQSAF
jgi:hypothetical protein